MNITEFAKLAGVSKAAVSRYFNGGYLSEEKRAQIAAAQQATGYRPSLQAQMLRARRTRQIGVILPKLSSDSCPRMVEGIGSVLEEWGYRLLLVNTNNDAAREVQAMDMLGQNTVDGLILIATLFTPEHKALLESLRLPVVVLGQQYPGCCCVYHDDFGAAKAATARMLAKGRRVPGCLGVTQMDKAAGRARRMGFEAALQEAGLPLHPERAATARFSMDSGFRQAEKLLARTPGLDCLFCATDAIALGAMQLCRSKGVRIPEDLMLASVGDSVAGQTAFVPLTSVHLHYRTAGQQAAKLLMEQLSDPHAVPCSQMLGYTLRPRASTGDRDPEALYAPAPAQNYETL